MFDLKLIYDRLKEELPLGGVALTKEDIDEILHYGGAKGVNELEYIITNFSEDQETVSLNLDELNSTIFNKILDNEVGTVFFAMKYILPKILNNDYYYYRYRESIIKTLNMRNIKNNIISDFSLFFPSDNIDLLGNMDTFFIDRLKDIYPEDYTKMSTGFLDTISFSLVLRPVYLEDIVAKDPGLQVMIYESLINTLIHIIEDGSIRIDDWKIKTIMDFINIDTLDNEYKSKLLKVSIGWE